MSQYEVLMLHSADELRRAANQWDDLWARSGVTLPTYRAENIALWLDHFAPRTVFQAVVVTQGKQWLAALPLVASRVKRVFRAAGLPSNPWCPSGTLLADAGCDMRAVLAELLTHCKQQRWPVYWFEGVLFNLPHWQALVDVARDCGWPVHIDQQCTVGMIDIDHDWQAFQAGWSRNHRRHIRRSWQKAEQAGGVELRVFDRIAADDVEPLLRRGFDVEDRSWKHAEGSSVLKSEGMFDFYCQLARLLAGQGHLELVFLEHREQAAAFELGLVAKGAYHSLKVGYDEQFAAWAPGQLLRYKLLERQFGDSRCKVFDFCGPLTDATAKWSTRTTPLGRLAFRGHGIQGRLAWGAYAAWRARRRRHSPDAACNRAATVDDADTDEVNECRPPREQLGQC